jgi:queuosine precursor transporter
MNKPIFMAMIAMAAIIATSNILVQFTLGNWLTWGALTYPLAFLVTDLILRREGREAAQRVVVIGFAVGIVCSFIAASFDLTTLRIAIASASAFLVAQIADILIFSRLRNNRSWWRAPAISSAVSSVLDTLIFFGLAFSATTYTIIADHNKWAQEVVPMLGFGTEAPLWLSLALADLIVKFVFVIVLLLPYRVITTSDR